MKDAGIGQCEALNHELYDPEELPDVEERRCHLLAFCDVTRCVPPEVGVPS